MEASKDKILADFIDLVHKKPVIWNLKHEKHYRQDYRNEAFKTIFKDLHLKYPNKEALFQAGSLDTIAGLKEKWQNLRSNFIAQDSKRRNMKTGSAAKNVPKPTKWSVSIFPPRIQRRSGSCFQSSK